MDDKPWYYVPTDQDGVATTLEGKPANLVLDGKNETAEPVRIYRRCADAFYARGQVDTALARVRREPEWDDAVPYVDCAEFIVRGFLYRRIVGRLIRARLAYVQHMQYPPRLPVYMSLDDAIERTRTLAATTRRFYPGHSWRDNSAGYGSSIVRERVQEYVIKNVENNAARALRFVWSVHERIHSYLTALKLHDFDPWLYAWWITGAIVSRQTEPWRCFHNENIEEGEYVFGIGAGLWREGYIVGATRTSVALIGGEGGSLLWTSKSGKLVDRFSEDELIQARTQVRKAKMGG